MPPGARNDGHASNVERILMLDHGGDRPYNFVPKQSDQGRSLVHSLSANRLMWGCRGESPLCIKWLKLSERLAQDPCYVWGIGWGRHSNLGLYVRPATSRGHVRIPARLRTTSPDS